MSTISSAGIGSGLDVDTIVSKLVAIERQPISDLQDKATALQADLSAFGKVQSYMSSLRDAARTLTDASTWNAVTAASSDATAVAVDAASGAVASSYQVQVNQLASAQQLASSALSSSSATVGEGTLTLQMGSWNTGNTAFTAKTGSTAVTITIGAGTTLAQLRDKINGSGAGVLASIVNDANGARLTLRSKDTGAANGFRLTATDADGTDADTSGLSAFAYDPAGGATGMTRNQAAANADLTINGLPISSASNTLNSVMDGLTLTLGKTTTTPVSVTANTDLTSIKTAMTAFATAYNNTVQYLRDATKYDAATKKSGELQGDSSAIGMLNRLRGLVSSGTGASTVFSRLSAIGFDPQSDGTLKTSDTKLTAALGNLTELKKAMSTSATTAGSGDGLAVQFRNLADAVLGADGSIATRQAGLQASIKRNSDQQSQYEDRATAYEKRIRAQYTALDTTMASMNSLSTYLTNQFSSSS